MLEKVSGSQQNNCEICHIEQANRYCKQCSKFLCQTCIDKHNGWADFSSHEILGVEEAVQLDTLSDGELQTHLFNC